MAILALFRDGFSRDGARLLFLHVFEANQTSVLARVLVFNSLNNARLLSEVLLHERKCLLTVRTDQRRLGFE